MSFLERLDARDQRSFIKCWQRSGGGQVAEQSQPLAECRDAAVFLAGG
jgi:hypothetical protein